MARLMVLTTPGRAVRGIQPPDPTPEKTSASTTATPLYPQGGYLIAGLVIFVVAAVVVWSILPGLFPKHADNVTFAPMDGVSAFAVFFLAAGIVERILEPFSAGLVRATPQKSGEDPKSGDATKQPQTAARGTDRFAALGKTKSEALTDKVRALQSGLDDPSTDPKSAIKQAAAEQSTADQAVVNGIFLIWSVATLLAVFLTFYFNLSLPKALGVKGTDTGFDLFLTAVIVGGGTKPLHDLISNMSTSSPDSDAKSTTTTS